MSNVKELTHDEIKERFESLFKQIMKDELNGREWEQADLVFRNGRSSESFQDVELMMANHQNGASLLYSSQEQGAAVYSVIGIQSRVSFSQRS